MQYPGGGDNHPCYCSRRGRPEIQFKRSLSQIATPLPLLKDFFPTALEEKGFSVICFFSPGQKKLVKRLNFPFFADPPGVFLRLSPLQLNVFLNKTTTIPLLTHLSSSNTHNAKTVLVSSNITRRLMSRKQLPRKFPGCSTYVLLTPLSSPRKASCYSYKYILKYIFALLKYFSLIRFPPPPF